MTPSETVTVTRCEFDSDGMPRWTFTVHRHPTNTRFLLTPDPDDVPADVRAALVAWAQRGGAA